MRDLMGSNLPDLFTFQNVTKVRDWINLQTQEDLDTLGLGLVTTRVDSTLVPVNSNSSDSTVAASVTQGNVILIILL